MSADLGDDGDDDNADDDDNDDDDEDGDGADWLTALTDEQIWIQSSITGLPNLVLRKYKINFDDNCEFEEF